MTPEPSIELANVQALLAAADAGAIRVHLAPEIEQLVTRALATRDRSTLRAASRALRAYEAAHRDDGTPIPPRLPLLLSHVRRALREGR